MFWKHPGVSKSISKTHSLGHHLKNHSNKIILLQRGVAAKICGHRSGQMGQIVRIGSWQ
jgi:hypothetical protein